jgi:hypothetical protein
MRNAGPNSVRVIREENFVLPLDDFYGAVHIIIDEASPLTHMSCDYLSDPMAFGLVVYPPRVYETIRKLKEQNYGNRASS